MKNKLKKALKSINYLIDYIYSSDISRHVYTQDFNALKKIKNILEERKRSIKNENKKH